VRNARIASLDTSAVATVEGFVDGFVELVQQHDFIGVVCKTPRAVDAAMAQIHVTWDLKAPINQHQISRLIALDAKMAEGDLEHVLQDEAHRKTSIGRLIGALMYSYKRQRHRSRAPRLPVLMTQAQITDWKS
jgi:hypothetical protein